MGFLEDAFICGFMTFVVVGGLLVARLIQMAGRRKEAAKHAVDD
jgi:hypothetical protein